MADIFNRIDSAVSGVINTPFDVSDIAVTGGRCGTTQYERNLELLNPSRVQQKQALEQVVQARIAERKALESVSRTTFKQEPKTIPLVIHVLYNSNRENISDDQINSQIEILNQDFSRTNPDATNTPAPFKTVAVDTGIRFCVVKVIRKKTNVASFSSNNDVKFSENGGSDAADTSKYLNVWVCNLTETIGNNQPLLGYGEFPSITLSDTYGVVINNEAFGTGGITRAPYNKGRTLTHEISHCLSVYHIFDESTTVCTKTDKAYDIPTQGLPNYGCPSFPKTDKCSLNYPGVMFMNYMDYTDDGCMNCFTKDQALRMNSTLESGPYSNLATTGCNKLEGSALPVTPAIYQRKGFQIGLIILAVGVALYFIIKYLAKQKAV